MAIHKSSLSRTINFFANVLRAMTPFSCQILLIPNVAAATTANCDSADYIRSFSSFSNFSCFSYFTYFTYIFRLQDFTFKKRIFSAPTLFPPIQPISNNLNDENNINSTLPPITIDPEAIMTVVRNIFS